MKTTLLFTFVLLLIISLLGCTSEVNKAQLTDEADEKAVVNTVEGFGKKLQEVSLLAPKDMVEKSMKENYDGFVSQELIAKWIKDPLNAPGRLTSSPWPDRIEIVTIEKLSENAYEVNGEILEITSTEIESGGIAAKRPITLVVKKTDNRWLINDVTIGDYEKQ